jgi:hypothetical protein
VTAQGTAQSAVDVRLVKVLAKMAVQLLDHPADEPSAKGKSPSLRAYPGDSVVSVRGSGHLGSHRLERPLHDGEVQPIGAPKRAQRPWG